MHSNPKPSVIQWLFFYVSAMFLFYLSIYGNLESNLILGSIAISMFFFFFGIGYFVFVERASLLFKRLKPKFCSIYDPYFWVHERHWKLADTKLDAFFKGTPFKNIISRLLGVKIGKMVFDEGICTEKTLTEIGDYCNINENTTLQAHSLEDGVFKSDYIKIGSGCSIGVNAFVHYGVKIENNVVIDADSFLMKGESPNSKTRWRGNPAREMSVKT